MTETDTPENTTTRTSIKKLNREKNQLNFDDKLFYDFLQYKMDTLLRNPAEESVNNILSYSKVLTQRG